jgi:hypothetical protein
MREVGHWFGRPPLRLRSRPDHRGGISQRTGLGPAAPPFKPCMRFSRTRLPDIAHREACAATYRTVPAEPVKAVETSTHDYFCTSVSMVGLLIHAAVGSLGGLGLRFPNRQGLAA